MGLSRRPVLAYNLVVMNILAELFWVFFKLGAFTVGGGIAMLPLLQNSLIHEKKWFTEEEFVDAVAVCQGLPGVIAVNMATYVGYKKKGLAGSVVSTFAVVTPSFVMILIIARFLSAISDNPYVQGAMAGFRVAALGLVVVAVIQLAPKVIKDKWTAGAAVQAFVLIAVFNINTAYVILLFIALGLAFSFAGGSRAAAAAGTVAAEDAAEDAADGAASDKDGGGERE